MPGQRSQLRSALVAIAGAIGSLLVLEIVLHVVEPRVKIAVNMVYDAELGHRGVENEIVTTNTYEYYNQAGFREKSLLHYPFQSLKDRDRPRVAFIGDSITLGYGIEKESRFTEVLDRFLLRHAPFEGEVFNFGTADYGTLEEYIVFERFAKLLHPDVVVLQFLGLNDFINNGIHFAGHNQSHTDAWRPYAIPPGELAGFDTRELGGLHVASAFPVRAWLRRVSYLFRIAEGLVIARSQNQPFAAAPGCNSALSLFLKEPGADWDSSRAATAEIAERFRAGVETSGEARFVAVYFPSNVEVVDAMWNDGIAPTVRSCYPAAAFDRWEGERKFLAAFAGAETFSLRDDFLAYPGNRAELFVPDGHLSVQGHRLAGEAIGRYLLRRHGLVWGAK